MIRAITLPRVCIFFERADPGGKHGYSGRRLGRFNFQMVTTLGLCRV
jgi:hypothetical protein